MQRILNILTILSIWTRMGVAGYQPPTNHKLLVILLDGLKWDYLDVVQRNSPTDFPGFMRLKKEGVTTQELIPVFPSLSFVNYYSLMTGLFAESHGMINNYMYDPKHNFSQFLIGENPEQYFPYWWDDGEPLWITAAKQKKRTYFWYWCGCEIEIRGYRPTFCQPYLSSPNPTNENFTVALTEAVNVLKNDTADIAGVFFEKVDSTGHSIGPKKSSTMKSVLDFIDSQLQIVQNRLASEFFTGTNTTLSERVNLVVFSDHGMTEVAGGPSNNASAIIYLYDYINRTEFDKAMGSNSGTVLMIWPWSGEDQKVYDHLFNKHPNLTVYKKQDIPERFHFKNHYRVPPIFLIADLGYVIIWNTSKVLTSVGYHGYDDLAQDMHGVFFAKGPDFKKNVTKRPIRNVNLYQMMCRLTNLVPAPHNGTWSEVCDLLADDGACATTVGNMAVVTAHIPVLISFYLLALLLMGSPM